MSFIYICILVLLNTFCFSKIHEKVVIGGICKNIGKELPFTIKNIEKIGDLFDDYRVVIYENNSKDQTKRGLVNWSKRNPKVFVQSEKLSIDDILNHCISVQLDSGSFARCENLARARNIVLQSVLHESYNNFNYFIMMDLDFDYLIPMDGIIDSFNLKNDWDVCFADGIRYGTHCNGANYNGAHYDLYTLLAKDFPMGPQFLGDCFWDNLTFDQHYDIQGSLIPVCSAFGGLGIYKKEILKNKRYSGHITEDLETWALKFFNENSNHPKVQQYFNKNKELQYTFSLKEDRFKTISSELAKSAGFFFNDYGEKTIFFRINCNEGPYPTCCEHVPLNISLYNQGYKLVVNPKMKLIYTH